MEKLNDINLYALNRDELQELSSRIRDRMETLNDDIKKSFSVGVQVFFEHNGEKISGVITKINKKKIKVNVGGHVTWSVPPQFLTKVL